VKISITNKTGFFSPDRELKIYDKDRKPFYFHNKEGGRVFNLPKGVYYTFNKVKPLKRPKKYNLILPKKERNIKKPKKIKVYFGNNPNKASIVLKKGIILMDTSFKKYPRFVIEYVLQHELGHYYYKSETGADSYARVQMLKKGYNPSQIGMSSRITLSPSSKQRIKKCYNYLKKA